MKTQTPVAQIPTPFATIYSQWLDTFRSVVPRQSSAALNAPMSKEAQVAAKRKSEVASVKPAPAVKKKAALKARSAGKTKKAVSAPARGRRKLSGKKKK